MIHSEKIRCSLDSIRWVRAVGRVRGPVDAGPEFRDPSKEMHSYTVLRLTKELCVKVDLLFTFNWEANAADIQ